MRLFYPPTEDQLKLMSNFYNLIDHDLLLWLLRFISLGLLLISLYFWFKLIKKVLNKSVAFLSLIIIAISPTFFILWMLHPIDCFKIFILILISYFLVIKNIKYPWIVLGCLLFLIFFSVVSTTEKSSFINKFKIDDSQKELIIRYGSEDVLINPVEIPLLIKRISYNKYYFLYKRLINEIIPFFDLETIFFQEIHPMEQKSVVLFYWPEIFLFLIGIYQIFKLKDKKFNKLFLSLLMVALINYLLSTDPPYKRFEFILFPLSLLIGLSINLWSSKYLDWFRKSLIWLIIIFLLYGCFTNFYDLFKRPDYWLDNRPIFYDFAYSSLEKVDLKSYSQIMVTSLVGKSELYCNFYISNCKNLNFKFDSFDLKNSNPINNSIYIGFVGEFVGSDFRNNIDSNWKNIIKDKSMNILNTKSLRDTIAYKYGNDILVAEVKNEK